MLVAKHTLEIILTVKGTHPTDRMDGIASYISGNPPIRHRVEHPTRQRCQLVKGPIRHTTAFGAPGVRFMNKNRTGGADQDIGAGGNEFLVRKLWRIRLGVVTVVIRPSLYFWWWKKCEF